MKKDILKSQGKILFPKERIAEFCRQHHIKKLAIFGSVLRPTLGLTVISMFW